MILYPTETIYALGANVFDKEEMERLYVLKGRSKDKQVSWLVRDVADIERFAVLGEVGAKIAKRFLPGSLTLGLRLRKEIIHKYKLERTIASFRISSDPFAQKLISEFMSLHNAPLSCTSANVSGLSTESTVQGILAQFGERASMIDIVIDDGPRDGVPSTVIEVFDDTVQVIREGAILNQEFLEL